MKRWLLLPLLLLVTTSTVVHGVGGASPDDWRTALENGRHPAYAWSPPAAMRQPSSVRDYGAAVRRAFETTEGLAPRVCAYVSLAVADTPELALSFESLARRRELETICREHPFTSAHLEEVRPLFHPTFAMRRADERHYALFHFEGPFWIPPFRAPEAYFEVGDRGVVYAADLRRAFEMDAALARQVCAASEMFLAAGQRVDARQEGVRLATHVTCAAYPHSDADRRAVQSFVLSRQKTAAPSPGNVWKDEGDSPELEALAQHMVQRARSMAPEERANADVAVSPYAAAIDDGDYIGRLALKPALDGVIHRFLRTHPVHAADRTREITVTSPARNVVRRMYEREAASGEADRFEWRRGLASLLTYEQNDFAGALKILEEEQRRDPNVDPDFPLRIALLRRITGAGRADYDRAVVTCPAGWPDAVADLGGEKDYCRKRMFQLAWRIAVVQGSNGRSVPPEVLAVMEETLRPEPPDSDLRLMVTGDLARTAPELTARETERMLSQYEKAGDRESLLEAIATLADIYLDAKDLKLARKWNDRWLGEAGVRLRQPSVSEWKVAKAMTIPRGQMWSKSATLVDDGTPGQPPEPPHPPRVSASDNPRNREDIDPERAGAVWAAIERNVMIRLEAGDLDGARADASTFVPIALQVRNRAMLDTLLSRLASEYERRGDTSAALRIARWVDPGLDEEADERRALLEMELRYLPPLTRLRDAPVVSTPWD